MKHVKVILLFLIAVGLVCPGCKKESPPSRATQDEAQKEKEFLSDQDLLTCELEKTPISQLDFKRGRLPSFVRRMERQNKEDVKQGQITLANRPFKILLGERPEREFYLFDVEKEFGPYWWGSWSLHSYHKIDDEFFEFMLIEEGTKIAAR